MGGTSEGVADVWTPAERAAWRVPAPISVAEWAEANRVLGPGQSSIPGPWRNSNSPYLIAVMNLALDPRVREVWLQKAAQVGASEAVRNLIGYWAERDPDPALLVLPDEKKGRRIIGKRILPLFEQTACLRALLTGAKRDTTLEVIELVNRFSLVLGYSGSGSSLKSDPIRYVIADEVDEFAQFTGRNAGPIDMARKRLLTYRHRARVFGLSTPSTDETGIALFVSDCPVQLYYWVPCPHCGRYQRLTFDRLKWGRPANGKELKRKHHAAWILQHQAAWFECAHCDGRIDNAQKNEAVRRGLWAVEEIGPNLKWVHRGGHQEHGGSAPCAPCLRGGYVLTPGGRRIQPGDYSDEGWPAGDRVGLRLPGWYALWVDLWQVAAERVLAGEDLARLVDFYNQTAGQPFKAQVARPQVQIFAEKCRSGAPPARVVPDWAALLIASVDVQASRFYYVIRAWGHGHRSQRVDHGQVYTWDELRQRCLLSAYPFADASRPPLRAALIGIDSGHKPHDVYAFALQDLGRIKVIKGDKPGRRPIRVSQQTYQDPRRPRSPLHIYLHLLDVGYFKDLLAGMVRNKLEDGSDQWLLNDADDPDYNQQMASEQKVLKRKGRSTPYWIWEPVIDGAANHYWDCEVYQLALADIARVDLIRPPSLTAPAAPVERKRKGSGWEVKPLKL